LQSLKESKVLPLWPAFFSFLFSVLVRGRSGILSTGILLAGVFILSMRNRKIVICYLLFSGVFAVGLLYVFFNWGFFDRLRKDPIVGDPRVEIARTYVEGVDNLGRFIWGYDMKDKSNHPIIVRHGYNLHNSILSAHSFLGFGGLVLFLAFAGGAKRASYRNRGFMVIYVSLVVRAVTDSLAFVSAYDFLFFYFFAFLFLRDPLRRNRNRLATIQVSLQGDGSAEP
jgi:hypothetical protein